MSQLTNCENLKSLAPQELILHLTFYSKLRYFLPINI